MTLHERVTVVLDQLRHIVLATMPVLEAIGMGMIGRVVTLIITGAVVLIVTIGQACS